MKPALLVVDAQYDFIWGSLGAGDREAPLWRIDQLLKWHKRVGSLVVASLDWHPKDHCSFTEQGGQFPAHCVHHTYGAGLLPQVVNSADRLVRKGTERYQEAFSAFDGTGLSRWLRKRDVTDLHVCGYCTDFCVLATVMDALQIGYKVRLYPSACAGVNYRDAWDAIDKMQAAGSVLCT